MNDNVLNRNYPTGLAPTSLLYLAWLITAVFLCSGAYALDKSNGTVGFSIAVYIMIIFAHFARIVKRSAATDWLAPDLVFLVTYSIFNYGYIFPYAIGLLPFSEKVFIFRHLMPFTLLLVNWGLVFFLGGYELALTRNRAEAIAENPKYIGIPPIAWYIVAWTLMGTALVFHFGSLAQVSLSDLLANTYYVIAHMDKYISYPIFFNISDRVFLLGVTIYFAASIYRTGKLFADKFSMVVILGFMIFTMLEGHRGPAAKLLIVILCAMWYGVRRIKLRWLIIIAAITLFSVGAIRLLRHDAGLDVAKLRAEYKYQKEERRIPIFVETFAELGGSVRVINGTLGIMKEGRGYWWGRSLVQAFVGTISRRITVKMGPTPAGWMTYNLEGIDRPGTGYSIVAEGYINFGIPGVFLVMFGVGYVLRRLHVRLLAQPTSVNLIILLIGLAGAVFWVRQNAELAIPTFMRAWILCGLINLVLPPKYLLQEGDTDLLTDYPDGELNTAESLA